MKIRPRNGIWRIVRLFVHGLQKKKNLLDEESTINLRVLPQDIDPFMELNNGRYVTLLDLGRLTLDFH